jgi:tetratricopeptide (TPR) repeat protein
LLFDYRPGLPLHEFWAVFVPANEPPGDHPAVSHVEQMYSSRCFQRGPSEDKLGCVSCHDPHQHVGPQQRVTWYRQRCLECHSQRYPACSLSRAVRLQKNAQDSCIDCHMPRYAPSDIAHTAATDHRILREPAKPSRSLAHERGTAALVPLRDFYDSGLTPKERQSPRYLALALVQIARDKKEMFDSLPLALRLLEEALVEDPRDLGLWEAKGTCLLLLQQRMPEALAAFQRVLAEVPNNEMVLKLAGLASLQLGEYEKSVDYWHRAAALNPWMADYRASHALALSQMGRWDEALRASRKAIELDPFNSQARVLLAVCLHRRGYKTQAQIEFERVRALQPPDFDTLRELFLKETR